MIERAIGKKATCINPDCKRYNIPWTLTREDTTWESPFGHGEGETPIVLAKCPACEKDAKVRTIPD